MVAKIFLTGASGYIGGTIFQTLIDQHPEYEITILQRSPKHEVSKQFPNVKIVKGSYDDLDTISSAASCTDIVIHNRDTDHKPCVQALIAGLLRRKSASPGYLIQLSGTDLDDIDEIWNRPDEALHRDVDKVIQTAYTDHGDRIRTTIVCEPDIYGRVTGPGKRMSILVPFFIEEVSSCGWPFYCRISENTRSWMHVQDLVKIHLRLVEVTASGGGSAGWNEKGYYFASSQELSQIQLAEAVGKALARRSLIEDTIPRQLTPNQLKEMRSGRFGDTREISLFMLASSCRTVPKGSREVLNYESSMPSLLEVLDDEVDHCLEQRDSEKVHGVAQ